MCSGHGKPGFASSSWHPPIVIRTPAWEVSDNGENVVAFDTTDERLQADFGWSSSDSYQSEVASIIDRLGDDEFRRIVRLSDGYHMYSVEDFQPYLKD